MTYIKIKNLAYFPFQHLSLNRLQKRGLTISCKQQKESEFDFKTIFLQNNIAKCLNIYFEKRFLHSCIQVFDI